MSVVSGQPRFDETGLGRPGTWPAELACLARHGFPDAILREAARLAAAWGVTGDEALLASGLAEPEPLYRALAAEAGLPFVGQALTAHPQTRPGEAIRSGLVPLDRPVQGCAFAFAPRGAAFADLAARGSGPGGGLLITTPQALRTAVFAARGDLIAREAAEALARDRPQDSFHGSVTLGQIVASHLIAAAVGIAAAVAGGTAWHATTLLLGLPFLGLSAIKLGAALEPAPTRMPAGLRRDADRDLPVYTVLVALYRETRVIGQLLDGIRRLDYPAAKLDVKLLIEESDLDTVRALAAHRLPGFVEVIAVPAGHPRTKPRALNVGLPLARGRFVVIYDAEDVPEPGQLRQALQVFDRSAPDVACLQARLVIDNTADSWLTRFFTVEYGALFDVLNPALARFDLPIPLGGTSNHFKVDVLRALGGWDPWNVTEDADLAMRLAVAGYRVADLPSVTLEEAPSTWRAWAAQRTRWMKGFVQVTITHSRRPFHSLGRLGLARFLGAVALVFGAIASALVYPIFSLVVLAGIAHGTFFDTSTVEDLIGTAVASTLLVAGLGAMVLPAFVAVRRRRWSGLWLHAALMPAYYLLVSWAAWRALGELALDPDRWNKTEHGLARTSRAASLGPPG